MGRKPISAYQYEQTKACLNKGLTLAKTASMVGVSVQTVLNIKQSRGYVEYLREVKFRTHRESAYRHQVELTNELAAMKKLVGKFSKAATHWHNVALGNSIELGKIKAKPSKKWYWPF